MKTDERMDALLNCGNIIRGYVYKDGKRSERWFEGTPENIASFLTQRGDADHMVLTDMMDMLVMDTIGYFIDTCPDKELLGKVKEHLIPMQMGEVEPKVFFCPTAQEANAYCNQKAAMEMGM